VTVRRYIAPTTGERELTAEHTGVILYTEEHADGWYIRLDSYPNRIFTGYQFLGAGEELVAGAAGPASLVTEVTPDPVTEDTTQAGPVTGHATWALSPSGDCSYIGIISDEPAWYRFAGGQKFSWSCSHAHPGPQSATACAQAELDRREAGLASGQARLCLRQARERLALRYPRAAGDLKVAEALTALGDALGAGPEATEPDLSERIAADVYRCQVGPRLWVAVDASLTVVLELTTFHGRVTARVAVSAPGLAEELATAHRVAAEAEAEADRDARRHPAEARRARGQLDRREAVEWLAARGYSRMRAANIVKRVHDGGPAEAGVTYSAGHWVVPAQDDAG
jgi:hypothetical protein